MKFCMTTNLAISSVSKQSLIFSQYWTQDRPSILQNVPYLAAHFAAIFLNLRKSSAGDRDNSLILNKFCDSHVRSVQDNLECCAWQWQSSEQTALRVKEPTWSLTAPRDGSPGKLRLRELHLDFYTQRLVFSSRRAFL